MVGLNRTYCGGLRSADAQIRGPIDPELWPDQILDPSPAIKLMVTARTTAPSRYDNNA